MRVFALIFMLAAPCLGGRVAAQDDDFVIELEIEILIEASAPPVPKPRPDWEAPIAVAVVEEETVSFEEFQQQASQHDQTLPPVVEGEGAFDAPETSPLAAEVAAPSQSDLSDQTAQITSRQISPNDEPEVGDASSLVLGIRARLGDAGLSGFCPLSESGDTTDRLAEFVRRDAFARQRIPIEAFGPCDEMLTFEPDVAPLSVLVRVELISLNPAQGLSARQLVNALGQEMARLPKLTTAQLENALLDIGSLNLSPQMAVAPEVGPAALLEVDRVGLSSLGRMGADGTRQAQFVSLTGLRANVAGQGVWVVTVNAGSDQSLSLSQIYGIFDTALNHMETL